MTKNLRRILSALVAFIMVMTVGSFSSLAADTYAITINDSAEGHSYKVYQIFSGTYAEGILSNLEFGQDVQRTGTITAKEVAALINANFTTGGISDGSATSSATAATNSWGEDLVEYLKSGLGEGNSVTISGTGTSATYDSANKVYTASNLEPGYYLVEDVTSNPTDIPATQDDVFVYSRLIVKLVGTDVTVNLKKAVPQVQKKVKDVNDSVTGSTTDWQDSADYDIGDAVPFQLMGTLPADYDKYSTYNYIFHDIESEGLTFNSDVVVRADNTVVNTNSYTVVTEGLTDGCTFEVVFADLKAITDESGAPITLTSDSKIYVEYTSTLNDNAKIGAEGNPNEVYLEFTNKSDSTGTGKTPKDKVTVFTFKIVVNKVDENNTPLPGAQFELYKWNGTEWVLKTLTTNAEGTVFTLVGLDDGNYKIVETQAPSAQYNKIDDILFNVVAVHDTESDDPLLTDLKVVDPTSGDELTTFTATYNDGTISTDIENQKGSTLPETGGMGTKIFYTLGTILVLGAGILLVAKRRMRKI